MGEDYDPNDPVMKRDEEGLTEEEKKRKHDAETAANAKNSRKQKSKEAEERQKKRKEEKERAGKKQQSESNPQGFQSGGPLVNGAVAKGKATKEEGNAKNDAVRKRDFILVNGKLQE